MTSQCAGDEDWMQYMASEQSMPDDSVHALPSLPLQDEAMEGKQVSIECSSGSASSDMLDVVCLLQSLTCMRYR